MTDEYDDFDDDLDDLEFDDDNDELTLKIQAFNVRVDQQMKTLLSRKASDNERREAAFWLGESGAPKAITALRKVYRGEKNRKVKDAAEYALGQFKALDENIKRDPGETVTEALQRKENAHIVELMTNITLEDKFGKRKLIPASALVRLQMILLLLLVILVTLNVVALSPGGERGRTEVVLSPEDQAAVETLEEMRGRITLLRGHTQTLQQQFDTAAAEGEMTCPPDITLPESVSVPQQVTGRYPNILILANRLNLAAGELQEGLQVYDHVCRMARPPNPDEAGQVSTSTGSTLAELNSIGGIIDTLEASITAAPTATPAPTQPAETTPEVEEPPTETPEPTIEPTPTIAPEAINVHMSAMFDILGRVTQRSGASTLLTQYWRDVNTAGRTDGCRQAQPTIPDDYGPIPDEVLQVAPALGQAREQLNIGLALLRQGWTLFNDSCRNNVLTDQASLGLQIAELAATSFTDANNQLNLVRSR